MTLLGYGLTMRGAISVAIASMTCAVVEERAIGHESHEAIRLEEFAGAGHDDRWSSQQLSAPILSGTCNTAHSAEMPRTPPIIAS
jgi:hypothetical protein